MPRVAYCSIAKGLAIKLAGNNKGKDLTDFAADISADYTFSNPMGPAGFTGRVGMKDSHLTMSGVGGHDSDQDRPRSAPPISSLFVS